MQTCSRTVDLRTVNLMCGSGRMAETWDETNRCVRTMHNSAYKHFWEMIIGEFAGIKYTVKQAFAKKKVTADDDAKHKSL